MLYVTENVFFPFKFINSMDFRSLKDNFLFFYFKDHLYDIFYLFFSNNIYDPIIFPAQILQHTPQFLIPTQHHAITLSFFLFLKSKDENQNNATKQNVQRVEGERERESILCWPTIPGKGPPWVWLMHPVAVYFMKLFNV